MATTFKREFVEGRLENCQTLIGIAVDGVPVAGAVGIPFLDGKMPAEQDESTVVYGLVGVGIGVAVAGGGSSGTAAVVKGSLTRRER